MVINTGSDIAKRRVRQSDHAQRKDGLHYEKYHCKTSADAKKMGLNCLNRLSITGHGGDARRSTNGGIKGSGEKKGQDTDESMTISEHAVCGLLTPQLVSCD